MSRGAGRSAPDPVPVALVGGSGHGHWHRREIQRLQAAGRVRLVAIADPHPVEPAEDAPLDGVRLHPDHRALLAAHHPAVVVICTPPPTHLQIALDALDAGADLLLEKPPVLDLAEHDTLTRRLAETGRACQVGFQALGSAALDALAHRPLGPISAVSALGAWWRPPGYWRRAPWAGRRAVDGVLANPLAHAVMQALAVADAGDPLWIEIERYRANPGIEVDDTATLRIGFAAGPPVLIAATLAASEFIPGEILVRGDAATATLEYPTDRLRDGTGPWRRIPGRIGLLENLLAHRADPGTPLRVPLHRTRHFTAVLEAVLAAPSPAEVPAAHLVPHDGGRAIAGIAETLRTAAERHVLLSELGIPWAVAPHRRPVRPAPDPVQEDRCAR